MRILGPGLFFTLFSFIFLAVGGWLAQAQRNSLMGYKPTDARVLSVDVEEKSDSDGSTYAPRVRYQYSVAGQSHECDNVLPIKVSSGRSWAEDIAYRFEPGQAVMAYYNPDKPDEAFLVREASFFPYIFILGPMIFTCLGLMMMFNDGTPGSRQLNLKGAPVVPTVAWNVVGVLVAIHYFSVADRMDLTAKVAFMVYGLVGGLLIYVTIYMKREAAWRAPRDPYDRKPPSI